MKHPMAVFLAAALLSIMLGSCSNTEQSPAPTTAPVTETTAPQTASEVPETIPVRNTDNDLLAVLSDTAPVLTEFGISQPLGEYFREYYSARITAFTLLDMNRDGENEMVVETDSGAITYGVIHFAGDTAYVYPFGVRQLGDLKADGSFRGSGSAFNSLYMTMEFAGGSYTINSLAECEYNDGWFTVDGKEASREEFEQFVANWDLQPFANWIYLSAPETVPPTEPTVPVLSDSLPYLQTIPRAEQPIFKEPSYDSPYMGVVQLAGVYTIVEEKWDEDESCLWGKLKSGAGWVDLSEIRDPLFKISVGYAEDALLGDSYFLYMGDESEYPVALVLRPDEPVTDFSLTGVDYTSSAAVITDPIFSLEQVDAHAAVVTKLTFSGDMSCYGVLFTDMSGVEYRYILALSGRNGMPFFYTPDN